MGRASRFLLTATAIVLLAPFQVSLAADCNNNGVDDRFDVITGSSPDCNSNFIPDECDVAAGTSPDANGNGVPDECDVDCDGNGVSDDIDIAQGTHQDCNFNRVPDLCDVDAGFSNDVNGNKIPDRCEPDCNNNGIPDDEDIRAGGSDDSNSNEIPDECDRAPRYRLMDLGTTAGFTSFAAALNDSGEVAGTAGFCCPRNPSGGRLGLIRGFRWQHGLMEDLGAMEIGSPPCSPSGCQSRLLDVNNCGELVGWNSGPSGSLPIVWLREGRGDLSPGYNLLKLPPTFTTGVAEAINNQGQIVGHVGPSFVRRPIVWEFDGFDYIPRDLGIRIGDLRNAAATDINEQGQVVGAATGRSGEFKSFLWLPAPAYGLPGGMNIITSDAMNTGGAAAINDKGEITGSKGSPWIWLPEPAYGLPAGVNGIGSPRASIRPTSLNDAGQIVASANVARPGNSALLFHPDNQGGFDRRAMLWQQGTWLILDELVLNRESWLLQNSLGGAINAEGVLAGSALNFDLVDADGESPVTHAYILVPIKGRTDVPRAVPGRVGEFNSRSQSASSRHDCRAR